MSEIDDRVYEYMVEFQDEQASYPVGPTARQIVEALDLSGPGYVAQIWDRMQRQGRVGKAPGRSAHDRFAVFHPTPLEEAITRAESAEGQLLIAHNALTNAGIPTGDNGVPHALVYRIVALRNRAESAEELLHSVMEKVSVALSLVREGDLVNSADVLATIKGE